MTDEPADSATITLVYDDRFKNFVIEDETPDMWITTKITVGETPLWNFEYGVDGLAAGIVYNLLDSIAPIINDERYYLTFEYGPSYLVVEPRDSNSVTIVYCVQKSSIENPDERIDIETELPVTKRAWAAAVLDTAHEFRRTVLDLNPDLSDHKAMESITENLYEIEALVEDHWEING